MIRNREDLPIKLAIVGAAGRMGRRLVALALEDKQFQLAAAIESAGHPLLAQDAGNLAGVGACGVLLSENIGPDLRVDVVIDFTAPAASRVLLNTCVQRQLSLVLGTTGLTADDHRLIDEAGKTIAVLQAANMSLGVNLMLGTVARMAQTLGDDYDIEITESHHRMKKDAPSGTALVLAKAICDATGKSVEKDVVHGRHGDDVPRTRGSIGMHALRQGDIIGKHTVSFATMGEILEVTHTATNRDVLVRGALHAAKWLADRTPGRYTMNDVLGL